MNGHTDGSAYGLWSLVAMNTLVGKHDGTLRDDVYAGALPRSALRGPPLHRSDCRPS